MSGRRLNPVLLALLVAVLAAGCGARHVTTTEESAVPEGLPVAETAREPAEPRSRTVSTGQAYVPAGFGDGSLWATDVFVCNDTVVAGSSASSASSAACGVSADVDMPLRRLDPLTGEEEATVPLKDFFANITEISSGGGFVWAGSADYYPGPPEDDRDAPVGTVFKIAPQTNRIVDRIPVLSSSGLAFGHGSLWVTSAGHGILSRIDPDTGRVTAKIDVGRGAVDVAVDEGSGAVWVAGLHLSDSYGASAAPADPGDNKLSRVDPATNRVVAEIPIAADAEYGGAQTVVAGEGAVWVAGGDGRLFRVDPVRNEVAAVAPLGDYFSDLKVSGGAVWATVQDASAQLTRLLRVDPRTLDSVAASQSVATNSYGRLAANDGQVWFASEATERNGGALARAAPPDSRR